MLVIPHDELSAEALQAVIEEFVTRDGTDYGDREVTLAGKVGEVRRQLIARQAVIVFDEDSGGITIIPAEQARREGLLEP
jgi:uncharacterized protein YheU (UPF0270 family)